MYEQNGTRTLVGAEVIVDKDRASALLAREIEADVFVMATDVDGVYLDWGTPDARRLERTTPAELRAHDFPAGSMGPKVEAACDFVERTGGTAAIGALADIEAIVEGRDGHYRSAWMIRRAALARRAVLGALAAGAGSASNSLVTIGVRPSIVRFSEKPEIFGAVTSAKAGEVVTVEFKQCGLYPEQYRAFMTTETTEGGAWSLQELFFVGTRTDTSGSFRARWGDEVSREVAFKVRAFVDLTRLPRGRGFYVRAAGISRSGTTSEGRALRQASRQMDPRALDAPDED